MCIYEKYTDCSSLLTLLAVEILGNTAMATTSEQTYKLPNLVSSIPAITALVR
jgi:hypothetical protein